MSSRYPKRGQDVIEWDLGRNLRDIKLGVVCIDKVFKALRQDKITKGVKEEKRSKG